MSILNFFFHSTVARIQFRLPDGSSFTNQFPSDAPLEEARQFAAQVNLCLVLNCSKSRRINGLLKCRRGKCPNMMCGV